MRAPAGGELEDPTAGEIGPRAASGVRSLLGRNVFTQILSLGTAIVLARQLSVSAYGTFAIVSTAVVLLDLLGDLGIAASFIRRERPLAQRDVDLAASLLAAALVPFGAAMFGLSFVLGVALGGAIDRELWVFRLLLLAALLRIARSPFVVQLERQMLFGRIARVEVAEAVVFPVIAVPLALLGAGVWSLAAGVAAQVAAGTVIFAATAPLRPRLTRDLRGAAEVARTGAVFQLGGVLAGLSVAVVNVLVAPLTGPRDLGFLGQATTNARRPLFVVETIARPMLSHLSRLQSEAGAVTAMVSRYILVAWMVLGLWEAILFGAGGPLVDLIYGPKWLPAVTAMQVLAAGLSAEVVFWLMSSAYAAVGRNSVEVRLVACRLVLYVLLLPAAVLWLGFLGAAVVQLVVQTLLAIPLLARFHPSLLPLLARRGAAILVAVVGAGAGTAVVGRALQLQGLLIEAVVLAGTATAAYAGVLAVTLGARGLTDLLEVASLRRASA